MKIQASKRLGQNNCILKPYYIQLNLAIASRRSSEQQQPLMAVFYVGQADMTNERSNGVSGNDINRLLTHDFFRM